MEKLWFLPQGLSSRW